MTRCRRPAKGENVEVFVVKNTEPSGDATVAILCEACGRTFFTNPNNRSLAMARRMRIYCLDCVPKIAKSEGQMIRIAGKIGKGRIIEFGV